MCERKSIRTCSCARARARSVSIAFHCDSRRALELLNRRLIYSGVFVDGDRNATVMSGAPSPILRLATVKSHNSGVLATKTQNGKRQNSWSPVAPIESSSRTLASARKCTNDETIFVLRAAASTTDCATARSGTRAYTQEIFREHKDEWRKREKRLINAHARVRDGASGNYNFFINIG